MDKAKDSAAGSAVATGLRGVVAASSSIGERDCGMGVSSTKENFRNMACNASLVSLSLLPEFVLDVSRVRLKYDGCAKSPIKAGVRLGVCDGEPPP